MRKKVMNPALLQKGWMNRATLARLFRGFSNEKRIRIIRALLSGWVKINDIADYTDLPYKTVERHLKILGSAGIVKQTLSRESGNVIGFEFVYRLIKEPKRLKRQLIFPNFLASLLATRTGLTRKSSH
jgi:DNA-binding transcriptional ArsR family regulator